MQLILVLNEILCLFFSNYLFFLSLQFLSCKEQSLSMILRTSFSVFKTWRVVREKYMFLPRRLDNVHKETNQTKECSLLSETLFVYNRKHIGVDTFTVIHSISFSSITRWVYRLPLRQENREWKREDWGGEGWERFRQANGLFLWGERVWARGVSKCSQEPACRFSVIFYGIFPFSTPLSYREELCTLLSSVQTPERRSHHVGQTQDNMDKTVPDKNILVS